MNLSKITILILLSFYSFTAFGQARYKQIKTNVDKINPVYAFIERASPNGIYKEKVLKTDKEGIEQIQEDKTLEFEAYEFVDINQVVTCWKKIQGTARNCCMGGLEDCLVWALVEMDLVYTDSIRLYKEQDLVPIQSEIFPNPVVDFLNVNANSDILQITIFDNFGRDILQDSGDNKRIDVRHLAHGNYTIQLRFKSGVRSHKFVRV